MSPNNDRGTVTWPLPSDKDAAGDNCVSGLFRLARTATRRVSKTHNLASSHSKQGRENLQGVSIEGFALGGRYRNDNDLI